MSEIVARAVWTPGDRTGKSWRGVIDQTEASRSVFGGTTGHRLWRCSHKHRNEETATRCAARALKQGEHVDQSASTPGGEA